MTHQFQDPTAKAFAEKHASCLDALRKEYHHAWDHYGSRVSFEQFLARTANDIERMASNFTLPKAVEFAEEHAADMPTVYVDYKRESRNGAVRLNFEQYLCNVAGPRYRSRELARRA